MAVDVSDIPPERLHSFYKIVNQDARARLSEIGIDISENEMAAWTAMFVHLKGQQTGKNGFFNAMCALAASEAAFEGELLAGEEGTPHG